MSHTDLRGALLMVDGAHGVNVPRWFIKNYDPSAWGISDEDIEILRAGPEHEHYWDAWDDALRDARCDYDGRTWCLYQEGDLWAVPVGSLAT